MLELFNFYDRGLAINNLDDMKAQYFDGIVRRLTCIRRGCRQSLDNCSLYYFRVFFSRYSEDSKNLFVHPPHCVVTS